LSDVDVTEALEIERANISLGKFKHYKCAIFDCDGVIFDSNGVKTSGFRLALANYPQVQVDELIEFHHHNGGISRYEKFEHFFRDIMKFHEFSEAKEEALRLFRESVVAGLVRCPMIPGAERFLNWLGSHNIPCFVISSADQDELQYIFSQRNLSLHFEGIYGSPLTKAENLKPISQEYGLKDFNAVYFGDSLIDIESASLFDIDSVFVYERSHWPDGKSICAQKGCAYIPNFDYLFEKMP